MNNISNEVMKIIAAIQSYIDKTGSVEAIDKYYQIYGTYSGIVEYLNDLNDKKSTKNENIE